MADPLLRDLALAADPVAFARACGVEPYRWQADALRSTALREAWVVARQCAKSTTAALLSTHAITYGPPGTTVVMLSVGQRQSTELLLKARRFYRLLGRPRGAASERETSLTTEAGSRLIALAGGGEGGATLRGMSADLLLIDEASRVPDDVYAAARPFVAVTGGRVLLLSTPWTTEGFFAGAALGKDGWLVRRVPADGVLDPGFLDGERRSMSPADYGREYECDFHATTSALWSERQWRALADSRVLTLEQRIADMARR